MRARLVLALALLLPGASLAQTGSGAPADPTAPRVTFVNMEGLTIDGKVTRPDGTHLTGRRRVQFDRLQRLDRGVLADLRATAHDSALR